MEGVGGQWQRQRPILRLAAGGSVNESRAGHVWVGRRDSPAAETDATVVRLNFFCQAPPSTGQKQTQMLVASVCVCACVCQKRERALFDSVSGSTRSTHKQSSNRLLFNPVHLASPPLCSKSLSQSYLHFSPSIFLTLSSLSFSSSLRFSLSLHLLLHLSLCTKAGSHCSENKKGRARGWR